MFFRDHKPVLRIHITRATTFAAGKQKLPRRKEATAHAKQLLVADQPYLLKVLPKLEEEDGYIPGILLFFILAEAVKNIDKADWTKFVTVLENLLSSDSSEHRTLIFNANIIDPMVNMLYNGTLKPEQVEPFVGPYSKKHIR